MRTLTFALLMTTCLCAGAATVDTSMDEAATLAILQHYAQGVTQPNGVALDPMNFADDVLVFWATGEVSQGRDQVMAYHNRGRAEVAGAFAQFQATLANASVQVRGDFAWGVCEFQLTGTLNSGQSFARLHRSSFVFERRQGRWQIIHEHSAVIS